MPVKPASAENLNAPVDLTTAGRALPHSLDSEKGLLAACLIDPAEVISRCQAQKLPDEAFYSLAHQAIYKVCVEVFEEKSILTWVKTWNSGKPCGEQRRTRRIRATSWTWTLLSPSNARCAAWNCLPAADHPR